MEHHRATVPAQPHSASSGWATTTIPRWYPSSSQVIRVILQIEHAAHFNGPASFDHFWPLPHLLSDGWNAGAETVGAAFPWEWIRERKEQDLGR